MYEYIACFVSDTEKFPEKREKEEHGALRHPDQEIPQTARRKTPVKSN